MLLSEIERTRMIDTTSSRIVTVTFRATTPSGTETPSAPQIAGYLAALLSASDQREPGFFCLSDPTVFMEPVAVVVNMTDGNLGSAAAEIPLRVVGVDYGAEEEICNSTIPQGDGTSVDVQAHEIQAAVRPGWVRAVLGATTPAGNNSGTGPASSSPDAHVVLLGIPHELEAFGPFIDRAAAETWLEDNPDVAEGDYYQFARLRDSDGNPATPWPASPAQSASHSKF